MRLSARYCTVGMTTAMTVPTWKSTLSSQGHQHMGIVNKMPKTQEAPDNKAQDRLNCSGSLRTIPAD